MKILGTVTEVPVGRGQGQPNPDVAALIGALAALGEGEWLQVEVADAREAQRLYQGLAARHFTVKIRAGVVYAGKNGSTPQA